MFLFVSFFQVLVDVLSKVKEPGADKACHLVSTSLDKEILKVAAKYHPLPEYILKWRKIGIALTQVQ
jgi:hypothetical protein